MAVRRIRVRSSFVTWQYSDIDPEEIWDPDGPAFIWCENTSRALQEVARRQAPGLPGVSHARWKARGASTGALRAGITAFGIRTGLETYNLTLNSAAPYSEFVHSGTGWARGSYIYSDMGWANREFIDTLFDSGQAGKGSGSPVLPISGGMFLHLPPGAGHFNRFHLRVRGQLANAFLYRAWNLTNELRANGEMGSFQIPVGFVAPPGVRSIKAR